ncbi:MAG: hypothetical protein R2911_16760 [Caldilineaceae bacterium]
MTTITITIEDELAQIVNKAVHRLSISQEEIVRQALYHFFDEAQESMAGEDPLIGMFDLGDPLLSENAEEILQGMFHNEPNSVTP